MPIKNVELTDEIREKLKSCLPICKEKNYKYVPAIYREFAEEFQAVFNLRELTGPEFVRCRDALKETVLGGTKLGEYTIAVCRLGITGWSNYYDETGKLIEYEPSVGIEILPAPLLYEICSTLTNIRELTEEQKLGLR